MEIDLDCHVLVKDRVQFILAGLVDLGFGEDERVLGWINKRCVEMEMAEVALLEEDEEINISIGNIGYTVCKKKKDQGRLYLLFCTGCRTTASS